MTAHDSLFRTEVTEARKQRLEGEVILARPVRSSVLTAIVVAIIGLAAAWIIFGSYTRSEAARGFLVTDVPTAKVFAARAGQVTELLVRDGDQVRAGQKLAIIRVELADENGTIASRESLAALDAQRGFAEQRVHLAGLRATAERERLIATLDGLRRQRADLAGQIALQGQAVTSARQLFESIGSVMERGFVSRVEYERRRQMMLAAEQQLGQFRQQLNAVFSQERQTSAELVRIDADARAEVAAAQTSAEGFAQRRAEVLAERAYVLTAPIAGRVTALQAAPGKAVDPSAPLMAIVPDGSLLHAEIYAPTRAIGFVRAGQEVRLLYDAFPYQRFGSFSARVTRVSRTVIDPRELAAPLKIEEPVYRIEVALDRQRVDAFGERLALQPGMTLSANLILERRSFFSWLLQPLNAVLRRNQ